jgi:N-acetylmuramic acid 6-phosphate etherase
MTLEWKKKAKEFLKVADKFKLGSLPTESPHPETIGLSDWAKNDLDRALDIFQKIDLDCLKTMDSKIDLLIPLKNDITDTLNSGNRVFLCGCGATGRLALTLERIYREDFNNSDDVISFMAGGDVALISSIEQFEDYEEWGADQLMELGFNENDLLIGSSEGGETPWVIGAIEKAASLSSRKPWFLYCNPDEVLINLVERSKNVLNNNLVNKLNLYCGEMALAGSTRLQASTILTLGIGIPLLYHDKEIKELAEKFHALIEKFSEFDFKTIKPFIEEEARLYEEGEFCHYECKSHLGISVLTDTTERSPTFSLPPFENFNEDVSNPSLCSFSFSHIDHNDEAWRFLLGRNPRTVEWDNIKEKSSGIRLKGYEISSNNKIMRKKHLPQNESTFCISLNAKKNNLLFQLNECETTIDLPSSHNLYSHIFLKMILNTHSTLIMGRLNRYESNIMTWVKSSNNKLIDRTARNVAILLKEKNVSCSYTDIIYKIFEEKESVKIGEPLVLKVVNALIIGHSPSHD